LFKGFEPGRNALSLVPLALPAATPVRRCLAQQHQCIALRKKIIAGLEPGEMLPLTLGTDEGKPEGRYFHFIVKRRTLCVEN
jgi:hypothetical protein